MRDCTCKATCCRGAAGLGYGWRCLATGEGKRLFEPGEKVSLRFGRRAGEIVEYLPDRNGYDVRVDFGVIFAHESNVLELDCNATVSK